uniref:Large ribosomal subunit protein mL49 n=1 Tax=Globodera rostochiensis TaxID=31243 RepID=A0A914I5R0_GLORO
MELSSDATDRKETGAEEPQWKNPYKHALPEQKSTYSNFREATVRWDYVRRLLPHRLIPEIPRDFSDGGVTPSGWRAPRETAPNLPYYIGRKANHLPGIYLERRRDELNPKTMDFEYVELVILTGIDGDVFACERDLRAYLEKRLGYPIATHVDELKGKIRIKGADRTLVEQFVYDYETEFSLCSSC